MLDKLKNLFQTQPPREQIKAQESPKNAHTGGDYYGYRASTHKLTEDAKSVRFTSPLTVDEAQQFGFDSAGYKQAFVASANTIPQQLFNWYSTQGFIGYQACALVSQQWLINNALVIPARDAARNGYRVTKSDGEDLDQTILSAIETADKKRGIHDQLVEYGTNVRRFGIRLALFCVESDDPDYYEKPFNLDAVKPGSYVGISQIDPAWVAPMLDVDAASNPASAYFYEPTWWQINGRRYHRTHFAISRYADLPDILKPTYLYGGLPLTQLLVERVYAAERTANEAPMLALTSRLNVLKTDMSAVAADPAGFQARQSELLWNRDNYGWFAIDADESIEQQKTDLGGLDDVIFGQYQLVAAVAGVPSTKLLGMSPRGFDSSGAYEQSTYYDTLQTIQRQYDRVLDRHHQLLIKSDIAPHFKVPYFETSIEWNPLYTPTAKERAEIGLLNRQAEREAMNTGSVLPDEIRARLINDDFSGFEGLAIKPDYDDDLYADARTD